MAQLQKVSWRTAGYAMLSCAVAATAVVTVVRSDGVRPVSLSSNPATRWLVNTVSKEVVLVDGLAGRVVARLDANATDEKAVQGPGGVFLIAKAKGSLRTITTATLQLGTARPLASLAEPGVQYGVGPRGLTVVNSATAEASIVAVGDVARPIKVPQANTAKVASDGSMWLFSDRLATHVGVDESTHSVPLRGTVDKTTTIGATAVSYDDTKNVVRWIEGGDVPVTSLENAAEAVLQERGDAAPCVWLGIQDDLVCVGRTAVERRVSVAGLGIGVTDKLAVAGSLAAVVRSNREIVLVDLEAQREVERFPLPVGTSTGLPITATNDMIWVDDVNGQSAWVSSSYGIRQVVKNDEKLPLLDSQGQVKAEGSGGNGPGDNNSSGNDADPTGRDNNGRDDPPNAVDDSVTARAGTSVTIPVIGNDTEPDGEAIALVGVDKPQHGTTDMPNGSSVTYIPELGFSGTDTFQYTISDENGNEAKATVSVKLLAADAPNQPPVARPEQATTRVGVPVVIDVLANDIDPEREALSVRAFQQTSDAKITDAKGRSGFPGLSYTPAVSAVGGQNDTFTYQAADPEGGVSTPTEVKVEVIGNSTPNRPPVVGNDAARLSVDQTGILAVLANDSDPDGDKLTLKLPPTQPAGVRAEVHGENLSITLLPSAPPRAVVKYEVTDAQNVSVEGRVLVVRFDKAVGNRAPVANPDTERVVIGSTVKIPVTINDIDPDNDPITVTKVSQPDKAAGTATVVDNAVSFKPNLPDITEPTPVTFTYEISDGQGNSAKGNVAVTVLAEPLPQAPFARDDPAETVTNQPVTIDVLANDSDPSGGSPSLDRNSVNCVSGTHSVSTDGRRVTYTPPLDKTGTFRCTYRVLGQSGSGDSASIIIVVSAPTQGNHDPDPGIINYVVDAGKSRRVPVSDLANDPDRDPLQIDSVSEASAGVARFDSTSLVFDATDMTTSQPVAVTVRIIDGNGGTLIETVTFSVTAGPTTPTTQGLPRLNLPDLGQPTALVGSYDPELLAAVRGANANRTDVRITDIARVGSFGSVSFTQDKVTLSSNAPGLVTASYRITDDQQPSLQGSISVNFVSPPAVNEPPLARDDVLGVNSGASGSVNVLDNDTPNIDPSFGDRLSIRLIDQLDPAFGTVSLAGDGQLTFTPVIGIDGQRVVRYTISDGAKSDTAAVTLTVNACTDIPPTATVANDFTPYMTPIAIDLYRYVPAGLTFRSVTGAGLSLPTGTYNPPAGENGSVVVTYVVANACNETAQGTLTIDVNRPPAARTVTSAVAVGAPARFTVGDLAADDEALHIVSLDANPAWVTFDSAAITANPPPGTRYGTFAFTATVADTGGLTGVATVTLTISNRPPVAQPDDFSTDTATITFDPVANDTDPENGVLSLQSIASTSPSGLSITPVGTTNSVTVVLVHGSNILNYLVRDDGGLTDSSTVSILYNQAPTAGPTDVNMAQFTVTAPLNASDPDLDPLITTCDNSTPGVTVSSNGIDLTITIDDTVVSGVSFDCRVTDPYGASATSTVTLLIP